MQGREMIIRDLRPRIGDPREDRGFPDIGEPDQTHFGDHFKLQQDLHLGRLPAGFGISRSLHGGSRIMHITGAAAASL